jgi:hypothetical protein
MRRSTIMLSVALLAAAVAISGGATHSAFSGTTGNSGNAFSAASSFVTCTDVTPVWMTGVEHGSMTYGGSLWENIQTAGGSLDIDSTIAHGGTRSLRVTDTSGSATTNMKVGYITGLGVLVMRFEVRWETLPTADVVQFMEIQSDGGVNGNVWLGFDADADKLTAKFGSGTSTMRLSSQTISAGSWYRVDLRVVWNANPHTLDWQVDGVNQTQATVARAPEAGGTSIVVGSNTSADVLTTHFDDMIFTSDSADYPIGDGTILALVPNATGTVLNNPGRISTNAGATVTTGDTSWQTVDEMPVGSTADYIRQTAVESDASVAYEFDNIATTGCINGVRGTVGVASSSTSTNSAKVAFWHGASEDVVYNGAVNHGTSIQYYSVPITPASGIWDKDKLNAVTARLGYATNVTSQPRWHNLFIEYNQAP